ncbi:MAG TPA: hypothetical protein VIZ90_07430 [Rhizobiaceae bacterium]
MNVRILAAAIVLVASPAAAQLGIVEMQKASGLAEVLKKSKPCGFSVDQPALEKYYAENGLATPEALSFILSSIGMAEFEDAPTESDCTMSKVTAKALGLLSK